jgi:hypothetical protein
VVAAAAGARRAEGGREISLASGLDWGYLVESQPPRMTILKGRPPAPEAALLVRRSCLRVDNARPSFLLGQRAEARTGERVGIVAAKMVAPLLLGPLMIYHPIPAASVARAREP